MCTVKCAAGSGFNFKTSIACGPKRALPTPWEGGGQRPESCRFCCVGNAGGRRPPLPASVLVSLTPPVTQGVTPRWTPVPGNPKAEYAPSLPFGSPLPISAGLGSLSSTAKRCLGSKSLRCAQNSEKHNFLSEIYGIMSTMRGVGLRNGTFGGFSAKQSGPQNHF
jgi:hypothetical protein